MHFRNLLVLSLAGKSFHSINKKQSHTKDIKYYHACAVVRILMTTTAYLYGSTVPAGGLCTYRFLSDSAKEMSPLLIQIVWHHAGAAVLSPPVSRHVDGLFCKPHSKTVAPARIFLEGHWIFLN